MTSEWSNLGEQRIQEAIASGELVPPPPGTQMDLDSYFQAPAEWRAGFAMLKGNGFAPPEVAMLKQAEALEAELERQPDADARERMKRRIDELRACFRMAVEGMRLR